MQNLDPDFHRDDKLQCRVEVAPVKAGIHVSHFKRRSKNKCFVAVIPAKAGIQCFGSS
jgi:hypothetical protein